MARKTPPAPAPAIDPAALAAALTALGLELPGANGAKPEGKPAAKPRQGKPASARVARERKPTTPTKRKRTTARVCNITAGEAWLALGADPEFEPGNPDKPASGPMLWRLNDKGMLADLLA